MKTRGEGEGGRDLQEGVERGGGRPAGRSGGERHDGILQNKRQGRTRTGPLRAAASLPLPLVCLFWQTSSPAQALPEAEMQQARAHHACRHVPKRLPHVPRPRPGSPGPTPSAPSPSSLSRGCPCPPTPCTCPSLRSPTHSLFPRAPCLDTAALKGTARCSWCSSSQPLPMASADGPQS